MKAVMYGGGNIGRGFIGARLSESGYDVTFIDVAEPIIEEINKKHQYPVRFVSNQGHEDVMVKGVSAINGNDVDSVAAAIAECDIMATAVGARILKFIMPNIVAGIRKRFAESDRPLDIIICENLMDANKVFEKMIKDELNNEERKLFDERIGLVEASIGRMVPVQTEEMKDGDPMRVCVEKYGFLPVDLDAFKGDVPKIDRLVPFSPFDFYIKRKLYVHNMGHAVCAYLGGYEGRKYIYQAIDNSDILNIVENAMIESGLALSKKYGVPMESIVMHILDLLERFRNKALKDTCKRVGGDPARKLSPEDRMIGSSKLALQQGITPAYITVGAAGAVYRYINEAGKDQSAEEAEEVLETVAGIKKDDKLFEMIMHMYGYFLEGRTLKEMLSEAQNVKAASLKDII